MLATQNPIEYEGTYPLPEAQLDRFLIRMRVGYPSPDDEWEILERAWSGGRTKPSASGTPALMKLARVKAAVDGRDVVPDDVEAIAVSALAHRLALRPELWVQQVQAEDVVQECLSAVPVPAADPASP